SHDHRGGKNSSAKCGLPAIRTGTKICADGRRVQLVRPRRHQGQLKAEGIELAFPEIAAETANLFYLAHPDDERIANAGRGIAAFRSVAKAEYDNVRSWHDSLMKIVPMYVLQWTIDNNELKRLDCMPLFGGMLSSLLKAVE
ncbi:MAG: hypothetical protein ACRD9S_26265, partial [Pyrinomonadaceae bacterium]